MAEAEAAAQLGRHLRQAVSANATSSGQTSIKAARELVSLLSRETPTASRVHALAQILEDEEQRYEDLCGDNSSSHRTGYPVGRILSLVQDEDDLLEKLGHNHLLDRAKGPALHAACLRLMRAILSVTGFQYPLTEDAVVDKLRLWALGPDDEADDDAAVGTVLAAANDAQGVAEAAVAAAKAAEGTPTHSLALAAATRAKVEALRVKTYATACLAVALEAEDVASAMVRRGVMARVMAPLREQMCELKPVEGAQLCAEAEAVSSATDRNEVEAAATAAGEMLDSDEDKATALVAQLCARGPSDAGVLADRLTEARLRAVAALGEFIECFGAALAAGALEVGLALIHGPVAGCDGTDWPGGWPQEAAQQRLATVSTVPGGAGGTYPRVGLPGNPQLPESLAALCSLLAHRKFCVTFVDRGGVKALLALPKGQLTHNGFNRCLFGVAQVSQAMERLLVPPASVAAVWAAKCVGSALDALDGGHDHARRHAALFLSLSFPFPAILDAFDARSGLRALLNLLRHAAQLAAGATATAKQTASHACHALRQYVRAHLHRRIASAVASFSNTHRRLSTDPPRAPGLGHRAVDLGLAATERNLRLATHDPRVAAALLKSPWLVMDAFIAQDGHLVMLALLNVAPGDRHFHDCVPASLSVLRAATLHPGARTATAAAVLSDPSHVPAMQVLMDIAARAAGAQDSEAVIDALHVVCNLVAPPPNMGAVASAATAGSAPHPSTPASGVKKKRPERNDAERFGAQVEARLRPARAALRESGGIRALLSMLLRGAKQLPPPNSDAARALCCRALLSLARDPAIAQTLQTLQVARRLTEIMRDTHRTGGGAAAAANAAAKDAADAAKTPGRDLERARPGGRDVKALPAGASTAVEAGAEFHSAAVELIALTAGGAAKGSTAAAASDAATAPLRRLERHAIAAATRVQYPHAELLQLIHEHLTNAGMHDAAHALASEARLPGMSLPGITHLPSLASPPGGARPGKLAPADSPAGILAAAAADRDKPPRLTRRMSVPRRPGSSAAGLFGGGSRHASVGTFTLGLDGREPNTGNADPPSRFTTPQPPQPSTSKKATAKAPKETEASPAIARRSKRTKKGDDVEVTPAPLLVEEKKEMSTPRGPSRTPGANMGGSRGAAMLQQAMSMPTRETVSETPVRVIASRGGKQKRKAAALNPDPGAAAPSTEIKPAAPPAPKLIAPKPVRASTPSSVGLLAGAAARSVLGGGVTHMHFHGPGHHGHHHGPGHGHDRHGCGVKSKLDSIMTTYLRAQHRQCTVPIAACAPFSLLEPHACVEPRHLLDAPKNLSHRLARREWLNPRGGAGGRTRDRHFVFSRFRPLRTLRDEGTVLTAAAFTGSGGDRILTGSHEGELRLFDTGDGDVIEVVDGGHFGPIRTLKVSPPSCYKPLALTCSSTEVQLWDVSNMEHGSAHVFEGSCGGAFDPSATRIAIVGEDLVGTARLIDCSTGDVVSTFTPAHISANSAPRLNRAARFADVCFSPGDGGMVLWGNMLWDVRLPHPVKKFDRFSDGGGTCFHPSGNSVILNSEVWDLRSERLLRSVPALDGTHLSWTRAGDVALASFRLPKDEQVSTVLRRSKHPLRAAYRTIDATDYAEIATVETQHTLVDLCWDTGTDSLCATVEYDAQETLDSVVRIHECGRLRPGDDDSDVEEGDDGDEAGGDESDIEAMELAMEDDDMEMEELDADDQAQARTALAGLRTLLRGMRERGEGDDEDEGEEDEDDLDDEVAWTPTEAEVDAILAENASDDDDEEEGESDEDDEDEDDEDDDSEPDLTTRSGYDVTRRHYAARPVFYASDSQEDGDSDDEDNEDDEDDEDDSESVLLSLGDSDDDEGFSDDSEEDADEEDEEDDADDWLHGRA